ncbi:hypothetical protein NDA17_000199 [Ustilago hordei]|nr:hypothetical protein NDA17_000199 [Ustilago hordei]
MPSKKKQRTKSPSIAPPSSPSSPCSTRSPSSSCAPATNPTANKKTSRRRAVKTEPSDPDLELNLNPIEIEELQVWDGTPKPQVKCWVEIPTPDFRSQEDELMFVRPRNKEALRKERKHKEYDDSFVWHVEQVPSDADPFHFAQEDLDRASGIDANRIVAVRPKATLDTVARKRKSSSTPVQPAKALGSRPAPVATQQAPAQASGSRTQSEAVLELAEEARDDGGLEDLFLGSTSGAGMEVDDPLFFEDERSNYEDRLRNGTRGRAERVVERQRIKQSPTLGDRIAKPSCTARQVRTRSSTPQPATSSTRPSIKSQEWTDQARLKRKKDKQETRKRKQAELEQQAKKRKKDAKTPKSKIHEHDTENDVKPAADDVKNLRSELNEDAFARSTGASHKEEYRNKLAKFAQARRKARLERGGGKRVESVSRGSSSSSSSSSSGDSSSDSEDFIVSDDQFEYDDGLESSSPAPRPQTQPRSAVASNNNRHSRWQRDSDGRIRLIPVFELTQEGASGGGGSVLAAHGLGALGARKGIDELCLDWLEWAVARVLLTWSSLSLQDRQRLERARAALKSKMRSIEGSVGSVTMRRQFKWYLMQYPKIELEGMFSDELDQFGTLAKQGCGVCHRRSQKPAFKVTFSGLRYNQGNIEPLKRDLPPNSGSESESSSSDDSDDSDSDRSSETETWREEGEDAKGRPTYTFFAGNSCAHRAAVLHKLHHWEWTTMQTLGKHDSIRFVRRLLWRKGKDGRGKDGKLGAGAWEVAFCVREMISPSGRATWPGKEKEKGKGDGKELERLRRRLKTLQEMAIDVNRAR